MKSKRFQVTLTLEFESEEMEDIDVQYRVLHAIQKHPFPKGTINILSASPLGTVEPAPKKYAADPALN